MSSTIKVRFLIDNERKRVVFAEAGSDFVDVLFSFLTLPLGRIVRLLNRQSCLGSLDNIYDSVALLDIKHLKTEACQDMLLNPRTAAAKQCEDLKIKGIHQSNPRMLYSCRQNDCQIHSTCYCSYSTKCACHLCGKDMNKKWLEKKSAERGGFVDENNFMITDDLRVIPISLLKGLSIFEEMQVENASMLEERILYFGTKEALNLLGKSLVSKNILTQICFPYAPVQKNHGFSLPIKEKTIVNKAKKEINNIKLVLNKKNNNILFAEVGEDFINLLFSFLTFPLGSVFKLFSNNISLGGCIKNLYSSAESMGLECFKSAICRNILLNPKLPAFYGCNKNQILQYEEIASVRRVVQRGCIKCYIDNGYKSCGSAPCRHGIERAELIEWNPKSAKIMSHADKAFVVGSRKYMISNDLRVSPLSIISAVGSGMNMSICDMVVDEVSIDNVRARSLLGAMLISKTVLTDVFSPIPTWQRKKHVKGCNNFDLGPLLRVL